MLNDELHITLTQHTPLVVSLEDRQLGYFLRATELKPKLNRFLQQKYKQLSPGKEVPVQWLIGKGKAEHKALDFAVLGCYHWPLEEAEIERSRLKKMINAKVAYLTATGTNDQALHFRIQSDHSEMLDFIQSHLPAFFAVENFGKRQSKGFGQFTVQKINDTTFEVSAEQLRQWILDHAESSVIYQRLDAGFSPDQIEMQTYRPLKAGINHTSYQKSYLWMYFQQKYSQQFPGWEKRAIKNALKTLHPDLFENAILKNPETRRHRILENENYTGDHSEDPGWYIRVLLGLAENIEFEMWKKGDIDFRGQYRPGNYERLYGITHGIPEPNQEYDKIKISVSPVSSEVEQFASPLRFKIFNCGAFMIPLPIPEKVINTKYQFEAKLTYKKETKKDPIPLTLSKEENGILTLSAPPDPFSLVDFLDFLVKIAGEDQLKPIFERLGWERFPPLQP